MKRRLAENSFHQAETERAEGRFDMAAALHRESLSLRPTRAALRGYVTSLLQAGRFTEGWDAFACLFPEVRDRLSNADQDFTGREIVVLRDEGLGDEIFHASMFPDLLEMAGRCHIACDERLAELFRRSFPAASIIARDSDSPPMGQAALPDGSMAILNRWLPVFFRRRVEDFHGKNSWLTLDESRLTKIRRRIDALGSGLRVGLSWRGGATPGDQALRSIPLERFDMLAEIPGLTLIDLQYGDTEEERERSCLNLHRFPDFSPDGELDGFAHLVGALDLVISVDNTTAHLAGALGRDTCCLVPRSQDWRWCGNDGGSPCYPYAIVLRQHDRGDWSEPLTALRRILEVLSENG